MAAIGPRRAPAGGEPPPYGVAGAGELAISGGRSPSGR
jgi:hypothetical protein